MKINFQFVLQKLFYLTGFYIGGWLLSFLLFYYQLYKNFQMSIAMSLAAISSLIIPISILYLIISSANVAYEKNREEFTEKRKNGYIPFDFYARQAFVKMPFWKILEEDLVDRDLNVRIGNAVLEYMGDKDNAMPDIGITEYDNTEIEKSKNSKVFYFRIVIRDE